MYSTLVFDIQGTLIRIEDIISGALEQVLAKHGLPMPDERAVRLYKLLSPYSFIKAYFSLGTEQASCIADELAEAQTSLYSRMVKAYDGAADTLGSLKNQGIKLYALSHRLPADTEKALQSAGILHFFDGIYQKTRSGSILPALASGEGLSMEEIVYVGDSVADMDEAEQTGCTFIPSMYGYGFEPANPSVPFPVPVLNDIRELPAVLGKFQ